MSRFKAFNILLCFSDMQTHVRNLASGSDALAQMDCYGFGKLQFQLILVTIRIYLAFACTGMNFRTLVGFYIRYVSARMLGRSYKQILPSELFGYFEICENEFYRPDGRVVVVPDFWRGRLGSISESIQLTQVAFDSPTMQRCSVCESRQ